MFRRRRVVFTIVVGAILVSSAIVIVERWTSRISLRLRGIVPTEAPTPLMNPSTRQGALLTHGQISLKNKTKEEAMKLWLERIQQDNKADWKTPIVFYGRIVDERGTAVPNARIQFEWTDLSSKGSSHADAVADNNGSFVFRDVQGKRLEVSVSKDGYYASYGMSKRSFEFSNPGEEIYYEPDSNNPIVFRLHKKGVGEKMITKSVKIALPGDGSGASVDLDTGHVLAASGTLRVQTWKPSPPKPMSPHYDWKAALRISSGGFADAPEKFAFEAPKNGYKESIELVMPADAATWNVGIEKDLYFLYGNPPKYGLLHFQTYANSQYVFITYVVNPSGSRNLESSESQTISSHNE